MALKNKNTASVLIISAGICWGVIGIFTTYLNSAGCSAVQITFLRCLVAALFIWTYIAVTDRKKLKIHIRDIWMFIGTGLFSIVFFNIMYFLTMEETTLSVAAILLYTAPCFVMIFSVILFKEKITKSKITALILAVFGCICTTGLVDGLIGGGGFGNISLVGILTGIGSGIGYAQYSVFGNYALKKYEPKTITAYTFLIAVIALLPFCGISELPAIAVKGNTILYILGIGIISTAAPFLLYTAGLKNTEPGRASVMAFIEPMVATIIGVFVFGQPISAVGIIGIILIFVSVVILNGVSFVRKRK